jgi:hypothetical protein
VVVRIQGGGEQTLRKEDIQVSLLAINKKIFSRHLIKNIY